MSIEIIVLLSKKLNNHVERVASERIESDTRSGTGKRYSLFNYSIINLFKKSLALKYSKKDG